VAVSGRRYADASCTCYLGQRDMLCKHVVALALHAVMQGQPLSVRISNSINTPDAAVSEAH
jgi:uncharacterized Zn finger protein